MSKHRICHISDTHGFFPQIKKSYDFIVHTGDMLPDMPTSSFISDAYSQQLWLEENIDQFVELIGDKTFLFVQGNHDFISPSIVEDILKSKSINAINIGNRVVDSEGLRFYGFPFIPKIKGKFNYELDEEEMEERVSELIKIVNSNKIDVLATHCGLLGVLDTKFGNKELNKALYKFKTKPKCLLHGHTHQQNGIAIVNNILISNAATSQQVIEIEK